LRLAALCKAGGFLWFPEPRCQSALLVLAGARRGEASALVTGEVPGPCVSGWGL